MIIMMGMPEEAVVSGWLGFPIGFWTGCEGKPTEFRM